MSLTSTEARHSRAATLRCSVGTRRRFAWREQAQWLRILSLLLPGHLAHSHGRKIINGDGLRFRSLAAIRTTQLRVGATSIKHDRDSAYDGEDPHEREQRRHARNFVWQVLRKPGQENMWNSPLSTGQENLWTSSHLNVPGTFRSSLPFLCGDNPLTNTVPSKFLR